MVVVLDLFDCCQIPQEKLTVVLAEQVYHPKDQTGPGQQGMSAKADIFFATGNKNKLNEACSQSTAQQSVKSLLQNGEGEGFSQVVAILEAGTPLPFALKAAELDLPELQGEPDDIARDKCRLAAQQVLYNFFALSTELDNSYEYVNIPVD